ncbi:hypothetical protein ACPYO6_04595 [Georgenia sp. Z1344]|uniref:hypothetical protein n=1 Tax=Georgenia sp. Z1344 TaxID=3416706 RepID=UPI003CF67E7E
MSTSARVLDPSTSSTPSLDPVHGPGPLVDPHGALRAARAVGGAAGLLSAVLLVSNALKLGGVVPAVALNQLLAPFAQSLAIVLIAMLVAATARRTGAWGVLAGAVNLVGLALVVAIEALTNHVFPYVTPAQVAELREGPAGTLLVVGSMWFLVGTLVHVGVLLAGRAAPVVPLVVYGVTGALIGLRSFLPTPVVAVAVGVLALAVAWIALDLLRGARRPR